MPAFRTPDLQIRSTVTTVSTRMAVMAACLHKQSAQNHLRGRLIFGGTARAWIGLTTCYLQPAYYPPPLEKSIKPGETIAATSGPGGTLRMHRPNWLRFFVTQLVVLSWQPFPVRIERQPVGVLQDAGVPHPGPADTPQQ
ncbi:hypothetical protein MRX96_048498 [Rhipicephalus microplus]